MNNLLWICFGICLTVFFPALTDYASTLMTGALNTLMQK
tara:strand:- start:21 stop:137 length:117 start_codon:yes stop_codon:yes gene_type:complete